MNTSDLPRPLTDEEFARFRRANCTLYLSDEDIRRWWHLPRWLIELNRRRYYEQRQAAQATLDAVPAPIASVEPSPSAPPAPTPAPTQPGRKLRIRRPRRPRLSRSCTSNAPAVARPSSVRASPPFSTAQTRGRDPPRPP